MSEQQPDRDALAAILADPRSSRFKSLRDRAAYMHVTGTYPSHLRPYYTRLLVLASTNTPLAGTGDTSAGPRAIEPRIAEDLKLETHAMVKTVRRSLRNGYRIRLSQGSNARKPYSKIWMFKGDERITIQLDGSVEDGWT